MDTKQTSTAINEFKEKCLLFGGKGRIADILLALNQNKLSREDVDELLKKDTFTNFHPDYFDMNEDEFMILSDKVMNRIKALEESVKLLKEAL